MSINYTEAPVRPINTSSYYMGTSELNPFQKMLLKANGTVTAMLEAYSSEPIHIVKLSENQAKMKLDLPEINFNQEEQVLARKVLLQGKISQRNFIYATSFILINNLEKRFSHELLTSSKPIGRIWSEQKVETFKEIIDSGFEPANELSNYFSIQPQENLVFRTYCVYSSGKITMIITEKFPESYFHPKVSLMW